jgi:hypothetical protein
MALLQVTHESTPAFGEVAALVDGAKTAVENARTIERVFPKFDCNEHPPDFECSYVAAAAICGDTPNWAIFNAFLCLSNSDPDFATPLPWPNYDNGGILNWAYIFCVSELVDDELVWGTIPAEMDQFLSLLQTLYTRDAEKLATAVNFTDRWGNSLGQAVAYEVTRGLPSLIVKYGANLLQSAGDGSLGDRMLSSARSSLQELQMRKPAIPENILKLAEVEVYKLFDSFRSQHSTLHIYVYLLLTSFTYLALSLQFCRLVPGDHVCTTHTCQNTSVRSAHLC